MGIMEARYRRAVHEFEMPSLGGTYPNAIDLTKAGDRMAIGFDEALLVYGMTDFQRTRLSGFDATKAVAFSPTNPYLAAANIRGWITVWNSAANRQLATLHLPTPTPSRNWPGVQRRRRAIGRLECRANPGLGSYESGRKNRHDGPQRGDSVRRVSSQRPTAGDGGKDDEVRFWNPSTGHHVGIGASGRDSADAGVFSRRRATGCWLHGEDRRRRICG